MVRFTGQEKAVISVLALAMVTGFVVNMVQHKEVTPLHWQDQERQMAGAMTMTAAPIMVPEPAKVANGQEEKQRITGKININTAGIAELETLPRIGPQLAQNIIDYRTIHGPYSQLKDLMNVNRIGIKTFNKIKHSITL